MTEYSGDIKERMPEMTDENTRMMFALGGHEDHGMTDDEAWAEIRELQEEYNDPDHPDHFATVEKVQKMMDFLEQSDAVADVLQNYKGMYEDIIYALTLAGEKQHVRNDLLRDYIASIGGDADLEFDDEEVTRRALENMHRGDEGGDA